MNKYGQMIEITTDDKDFPEYQFVLRAVSKDETRLNLINLLVDAHKIVCCDGYRIHLSEINEPLEDGLYLPVKASRSEILLVKNPDAPDFPAYEGIFPKTAAAKEISFLSLPERSDLSGPFCRLVKTLPDGQGLSFEFFKGLTGHEWTVEIFMREPCCQIMAKGVQRTALINGMRV